MVQFLEYKLKETTKVLELKEDSIAYVDIIDDQIHLYEKPLGKPTPKILTGKSSVFFVSGEYVNLLQENQVFEFENITFKIKPQDYILLNTWKKVKPKISAFFTEKKHRPKLLGSLAVFFLLIIGTQFFSSSGETSFNTNVKTVENNLEGKELIEILLKLANHAIAEEKYALTLEHVEKILSIDPKHAEALALKEKASEQAKTNQLTAKKDLKQDIRVQQLLTRATNLMNKKDYKGSLFLLEQILDDDPEHSEANRLTAVIKKEIEIEEQKDKKQKALQAVHLKKAEELWKIGEAEFQNNNLNFAWKNLNEALEILNKGDLTPFFKHDLSEMRKKTEAQLVENLKPTVDEARDLKRNGDRKKGVSRIQSYKNSLEKYFEVQNQFSNYPFLDTEMSTTIGSLDNALKTYFTEAQVIKDLDGCCAAKPYYTKILNYAGYDVVPYYQKAQEALSACPCK